MEPQETSRTAVQVPSSIPPDSIEPESTAPKHSPANIPAHVNGQTQPENETIDDENDKEDEAEEEDIHDTDVKPFDWVEFERRYHDVFDTMDTEMYDMIDDFDRYVEVSVSP